MRFRLGGRTSMKFSRWYELNGYVAYGVLDEKWKYSLGFKSFLTKKPRRQLVGVELKSDYKAVLSFVVNCSVFKLGPFNF